MKGASPEALPEKGPLSCQSGSPAPETSLNLSHSQLCTLTFTVVYSNLIPPNDLKAITGPCNCSQVLTLHAEDVCVQLLSPKRDNVGERPVGSTVMKEHKDQ